MHKHSRIAALVGVAFWLLLTTTGCVKDGNDTIVLPLPNGTIPTSVIPRHLQDSLANHGFVINEGLYPPTIDGSYLISQMQMNYASDDYVNTFYNLYITFADQQPRGILNYSETQHVNVEGASIAANVIGSGDDFTMYCYQYVSETDGEVQLFRCKTATVISGTKAADGIRNCQYAYILLEKEAINDDYNAAIPAAETYRIYADSDSLAVNI